ncbi:MAG: sigma-70 family RNA polymerase sigma factor [Bacteroidetes bacterium]|nr:sigma-70 family RNA polymerase sigma factor [Bacteroidota bacterium]
MIDENLEKLLNACRQNNRAAQKEIYEFYYAFVFSIIRRYVGSFEESKEVTNDVFFKIFTKLNQYQEGTNFKGWMTQLAKRVAIDRYRADLNKLKISEVDIIPDSSERFDIQLLNKMEVEEKILLIQKLSPSYRLVFNLYVIEQYSHEEIAKLLNISSGTSKSNLAKARIQLKSLITKYQYV